MSKVVELTVSEYMPLADEFDRLWAELVGEDWAIERTRKFWKTFEEFVISKGFTMEQWDFTLDRRVSRSLFKQGYSTFSPDEDSE